MDDTCPPSLRVQTAPELEDAGMYSNFARFGLVI